jgi:hypothetical protein
MSVPCLFVSFSFVSPQRLPLPHTLCACKRMLPFEALSFGLKVPEEHEEGDAAPSREQYMNFGISVGAGATVVCRWDLFNHELLE